jgi:hypothetical protein
VFLLFLLFLPVTLIALIVISFKVFVLNKNINIKPILLMIAKNLSPKEKDEDDDYDVSEEDLIMVGVEDITNKKN